ncbi:MAG: hypothetical protein GXP22_03335 [Gammaproteobacteria bacterium]|nr:hypothetical protein [Gammaproteobacteria bacterium]
MLFSNRDARETIHGGSMPASMRATVSVREKHSLSLELTGSRYPLQGCF